jgi:hypothetical protein
MVCKPFGFEQKGELINNRTPTILIGAFRQITADRLCIAIFCRLLICEPYIYNRRNGLIEVKQQ